MIVDITNEILTDIKKIIPSVTVLSAYPFKVAKFPIVIITEEDNSAVMETKDSAGFHHSYIAFSIEIYTIGNKRMSEAKEIRNLIDSLMSGEYGMSRSRPQIIPNYLDDSIYRYKLTYTGIIDKNKKIYRG